MIPSTVRFLGMVSTACLLAVAPMAARAQQIALTFDDLPSHSTLPKGETRGGVASRIIAALDEAGAPPTYGFINGGSVIADPESQRVLALWVAAGHPLGNHTWSHLRLNDADPAAFQNEIQLNEPLLAALMPGRDWRWFRYPYLFEGGTAQSRAGIRTFLAGRGYRIASVTLSFDDYAWNEPYARCADRGDTATIERLEASYLAAARASFVQARARSQTALGRDVPYVLLMHIGAFDAHMLPRLLDQYRRDGATFVTLDQAESDAFYRGDTVTPFADSPVGLPPQPGDQTGSFAPADLAGLCQSG